MIELWKAVGIGFGLWCLISAAGTITFIAVRKLWP